MGKSWKKKLSPDGDPSTGGQTAASGPGEAPAAEPAPSVEEDGAALDGWWVQGRVSRLLPIDWRMGTMRVYHLRAYSEWSNSFDFDLEDRDGARQIVRLEDHSRPETKTPAFEYRLRSDRLELRAVPGADWHQGYPNPKMWELGGAWFRLRFPDAAAPGAAADRGGSWS